MSSLKIFGIRIKLTKQNRDWNYLGARLSISNRATLFFHLPGLYANSVKQTFRSGTIRNITPQLAKIIDAEWVSTSNFDTTSLFFCIEDSCAKQTDHAQILRFLLEDTEVNNDWGSESDKFLEIFHLCCQCVLGHPLPPPSSSTAYRLHWKANENGNQTIDDLTKDDIIGIDRKIGSFGRTYFRQKSVEPSVDLDSIRNSVAFAEKLIEKRTLAENSIFGLARDFQTLSQITDNAAQIMVMIVSLERYAIGDVRTDLVKRLCKRVTAVFQDGSKKEHAKNLIKVAYNVRSRLIHGDSNLDEDELFAIAKDMMALAYEFSENALRFVTDTHSRNALARLRIELDRV